MKKKKKKKLRKPIELGIDPRNEIYALNNKVKKYKDLLNSENKSTDSGKTIYRKRFLPVVEEEIAFYNKSNISLRKRIINHFKYCSLSNNLLFIGPPFNFESLIDLCNEGVLQKPKSFRAYYYLAKAKELSGDILGSISEFDKLIESKPLNANLYKERGRLRKKANDEQGSIEDINKMIYLKTSLPEEDFYKHKRLK